ncbi:MAG: asparagine synthase (glutamine-hydrolyzing) [Nitrospirae bacterium]|nr:asparagine synthase (glutamine-hydrolyzing) [Nitrospirota bacterium]
MCGIAGCSFALIQDNPEAYLQKMNDVMLHRGPDDGDFFFDNDVALCHRRLSIIDLSSDGRQPMQSADGKFTIVFNGEIYNFLELRKELQGKGHQFRTKTDTEVLLSAYREYGVECLQKIRGMYAFAIWDISRKELFLCRDRIGKKPLYYYYDGESIAFASEIKSMLQIPCVHKVIDPTSVIDYLKYLYVPHPKSIYKNIFKLEPGHFLIYKKGKINIDQYWDIDFSKPLNWNAEDIAGQLLAIISDSVKTRLISDVPLGAFLSGGIDSSAVVALMAGTLEGPVKTCTIGFDESAHNEAEYAKEFSRQYGTEHHEYYIRDNADIDEVIKKLVWHFDEPFADSSMVPTYHVCRVAREIVTVAISGDGGDESFGGYEKYSIDRIENRVRSIVPHVLLNALCSVFNGSEKGFTKKIYSLSSTAKLSPAEGYYITNTFFPDDLLGRVLSDVMKKETGDYNPGEHTLRYYNRANGDDHFSKILYTDLKSFLPGDILVKVDRMSMANSLEVRSPLLDHKVIEFAAKVPSMLKVKGKSKKIILKEAFGKILTSEIMNRRKHGFEVPLDNWFRVELKHMAYDYLFSKDYMSDFFNVPEIMEIWEKHRMHKANYGTVLWSLFMFSLWFEEFIET